MEYPTTNDLRFTAGIATALAAQAKVPVAVHLDHGANLGQVAQAIRAGMTSVMYDGSSLPTDENIANVRKVVEMASPLGISVEAEIGHVGQGAEYDQAAGGLTDPEEAKMFIEETGVDACAVAIGSAHGAYSGTPHLDFDRLAAIKEMTGIPLVLHGSSGTGEENIRKVCRLGINKVNVCNDILRTVYEELKQTDMKGNDVYDLWPFVAEKVRNFVKRQIDITGSEGKAWEVKVSGLPRGVVTMRE
ncbi:MAG: class II fructose-bisphosphate aldolase [Firmicutes bacterium]|nr:class II fructose-bisphosphate aldolase [Bacillota bacterium]